MRLLFLIVLLTANTAFAQDKFWITFKDKDIREYNYEKNLSKETIQNRIRYGLDLYQFTDVPLKQEYLKGISEMGIQIQCKSKWLNSVSAYLSPDQLEQVSALNFVSGIYKIDTKIQITGSAIDVKADYYEIAIRQMGAQAFKDNGLSGKGVFVGVIDAGFYKAFSDQYLGHVFIENKIIKQRDFLPSAVMDLVRDTLNDADNHGRQVLSWICGYDSLTKMQRGLAVNSKFYIARTENESKEHRGEEDNWIMAMEWMDSLGVRLINTSLGYSINMDDPKDNYKKEEMNGKTARISKAAQIATDQKGIFLVVSAGNEGGNSSWKIVSAPADAEGVLSIGATKNNWERIGYSSIGPEFLPYLKPNVSCFSLYGTSFSAPAITGFVACLMEKNPTLNNKQLKEIVEKSGHLYPYGNNYLGYGVPQAGKALKLIENKNYEFDNASEKKVKGKKALFKFDKELNSEAVVFHKKNKTVVLQQQVDPIKDGKLIIKKIPGAERTTVSIGLEVIEIVWE